MNRNKLFIATGITTLAVSLGLSACGGSGTSGQAAEQSIESRQLSQYNQSQPIPFFKWSLERQVLIDAETASAEGDQSTSFFFNYGVQDPIMTCPSLGMAVPDTAQLSNPQQVLYPSGRDAIAISQADPFGVYSPPSSEGTYVICVIDGKPVLQRAEEQVHTVMAPARWDSSKHQIVITGNPTTDVKTHR
jgi:hypothetical protein